ncbi:hypothetical protein [Burkholderia sp. BCC0405]|uniref:hypothetical protein n=1 Tax=Burkholderia sp. BCC0405 TaxID=2676298 RepID=UPI001FC8122B|nr:hypothetical protein [Burkholderia sp. BCC0405]
MPGGEQVEQLLFRIEAVRVVLGREILQRRRGGCPGVAASAAGRIASSRAVAKSWRLRAAATNAVTSQERVAAEFEVLVGQLGEIQPFQIAAEEGEVLQADPALGGRERDWRRAAGVGARRGAAGNSRNSTSSTSGSWAIGMGDGERDTKTVLFDTVPRADRRRGRNRKWKHRPSAATTSRRGILGAAQRLFLRHGWKRKSKMSRNRNETLKTRSARRCDGPSV